MKGNGEQSVMITGALRMPELCADNSTMAQV